MVRQMTTIGLLFVLIAALAVSCGCSAALGIVQPATAPATGVAEGTAKIAGEVQRVSVDLSSGVYIPTVIRAKAGVPLEISFGQGQGCLAKVLIPAFQIDTDLTQGGAVVKLPAMSAGEYEFSCGMKMVFGKIVVE